jgi:HSP20 family protein
MLPSIWRNHNVSPGYSGHDFFDDLFFGWPEFRGEGDFAWTPRVDIQETDKEIILDFELPGIDKKDIKVELKDSRLTVSGERKQETKSNNAEHRRTERHYGKYERSFTLPDTVSADKVSAEYKNGILTLNLPKTEKAISKEIAVEVK